MENENAPVSIAETNNESEDKTVDLELPRSERTKHFWRNLTDIPVFGFFFAYSFSETIFTNLIIYRTCMVTLGYNETICSSLVQSNDHNATKDLELEVQEYASKIIMGKSLVMGIFPALISLILGPWSDSNGRKPLIYLAMSGYSVYFILSCGLSLLETLNPWWLLLPAVPYSLLGGLSSIITGCFCYINDVTIAKDRSFRMGVMEAILLLGILLGSLSSPYAFKAIGYACIFAICAVVTILATIYAFCLEESLPEHEMNKCSIFNLSLATGMIKTCFKQRTHYRRAILWMVMLSSALAIFSQEGDLTVTYLFTREKLDWVLSDYAWYGAFGIFSSVLGIFVSSFFFQKFLHLHDSVVSLLSFFSALIRSILTAFATSTWNMYVASGVSSLRASFGPTNRAMLTKVVPQEDVGKVLSLTTSLESIIPLIAAPLYSVVYQHTLDTFSGLYNFISAGIFVICFVLIAIVDIIIRRNPSTEYDLLDSE